MSMPTLRHAIEKYYLSIFVVSMVVMSAVLILLLHSLAIKRIDQEMLVFTNDLLKFLERPEGQPVAIFGKKNYAFHVTEQGRQSRATTFQTISLCRRPKVSKRSTPIGI